MSQRRAASLASQGSERTVTSTHSRAGIPALCLRLTETLGMELRRQGIPPAAADWPRGFAHRHLHLLPAGHTASNKPIHRAADSDMSDKYSALVRRNGDAPCAVLLVDLAGQNMDDRYCIALCEALIKLSSSSTSMTAASCSEAMLQPQQAHYMDSAACWYVLLSNNAITDRALTHLRLLLQCCLPLRYVALDGNALSAHAQQELAQCAKAATAEEGDEGCRVVFCAEDIHAGQDAQGNDEPPPPPQAICNGVCTPRARSAEMHATQPTTAGTIMRCSRSYSPPHTSPTGTHTSTTASRRRQQSHACMTMVDMDALQRRRAQLFGQTPASADKAHDMTKESDEEKMRRKVQEQSPATPANVARHIDLHEPVTPDAHEQPHATTLTLPPPPPPLHAHTTEHMKVQDEDYSEDEEEGPDVTAHVSTIIDSVLDLASVTDGATGELNAEARTAHTNARTVWDIVGTYAASRNEDAANKENIVHASNTRPTSRNVRKDEQEEEDEEVRHNATNERHEDVSQLSVSATSTSWTTNRSLLPTSFQSITVLRLNGNYLKELTVLPRSLLRLDISDNALTSLAGLAQCPMLTVLNARRNRLTAIAQLEHNRFLAHLFLGRNRIKVVEGLAHMFLLETLDLSHNCIRTASALRALSLCSALQHLLLKGNPCLTTTTSSSSTTSKSTLLLSKQTGKQSQQGRGNGRHPLYVMLRNLCPTLRKVDEYSFSSHSRYAEAAEVERNVLCNPSLAQAREQAHRTSTNADDDNNDYKNDEEMSRSVEATSEGTTPNAMHLLRLLTRGVTPSAGGYSEAARSKAASLVNKSNTASKQNRNSSRMTELQCAAPGRTAANNNNSGSANEAVDEVPAFRTTFIDEVTRRQTRHKAGSAAAAHRSALREHAMQQLAAESQRFLQTTLTERLGPVLQEEKEEEDKANRQIQSKDASSTRSRMSRAQSHSQGATRTKDNNNSSNNNNTRSKEGEEVDSEILRPYAPRPFRPPPRPSRRSATRPVCDAGETRKDEKGVEEERYDNTPTSSYAALHRAETKEKEQKEKEQQQRTSAVNASFLSITLSPSPSPRRQQSVTRPTATPAHALHRGSSTSTNKTPQDVREVGEGRQDTRGASHDRPGRVLLSPAAPSQPATPTTHRTNNYTNDTNVPQLSPPPPLPPTHTMSHLLHAKLSPSPGQVHLGSTCATPPTSTEPIADTPASNNHAAPRIDDVHDDVGDAECVTWLQELHASVDGVQAALRSVVQLILAQRQHSSNITSNNSSSSASNSAGYRAYSEGTHSSHAERNVEKQARCIVLERQRCVKLLEASGMLADTHVPRRLVRRFGFTEAELNGEQDSDATDEGNKDMSRAWQSERRDVLQQLHVLADAKTCLRYAVLLMREGREQTLQRYVDQVNDTVYNSTLSATSA